MDSDKVKYFLLLKRGKICFSGDIFVCVSMIFMSQNKSYSSYTNVINVSCKNVEGSILAISDCSSFYTGVWILACFDLVSSTQWLLI